MVVEAWKREQKILILELQNGREREPGYWNILTDPKKIRPYDTVMNYVDIQQV